MPTTTTYYNNIAVLIVKDELAGDEVGAFVAQAERCIKERKCDLVLDCSSLEGLDSKGLEALVDLQSQCENELGSLKLCKLNPNCAKILEITRLARRFASFEDLESAVRSFA